MILKQNLILIGASGVAHEIIDTIFDINELTQSWNLLGILDDDLAKTGSEFYRGVKILGTSKLLSQLDLSKTKFLITFSSPVNFLNRENYIANLLVIFPDIQFATLIHPSAYVSKTAQIGSGVFFSVGVVVDSKAIVADHAIVLFHSVVSRFVSVGKYSFISAGVNIVGHRSIGKNVYVGAKCTINADISNNVLLDSSIFIKQHIPENSVVSVKSEIDILTYKSSNKLKMMLRGL